jgi:signal recognition particle receptor subunit beta
VSSINFHTKEISVKIVYYGPGLCGKTTSLQTIYGSLPENKRPQLVSLATEVDRTIFFDFLPVTAYRIRDFVVRLQLYTVPGQVFYNATRKLVLNGVDGIVFVADSQKGMRDSNLESLQNLDDNLAELGLELGRVPLVMQFNKRDLPEVDSLEEMQQRYNRTGVPAFATIATRGDGLFDALKAVSQLVVNDLVKKGLGRQILESGGAGTGPQVIPAAPPPTLASGPVPAQPAPAPMPMAAPAAVAPPPRPPTPPPQSMADAMARAARTPVPTPRTGALLWPAGDVSRLGERVEAALQAGRWVDVVYGVEQIVHLQARRWAQTENVSAADPMPQFLLMRGVAPNRYRALWEAGRAVRAGQPVGRDEAMSALVLALETIW